MRNRTIKTFFDSCGRCCMISKITNQCVDRSTAGYLTRCHAAHAVTNDKNLRGKVVAETVFVVGSLATYICQSSDFELQSSPAFHFYELLPVCKIVPVR